MTVFVRSIVIISFKFLFVDCLGPTATLKNDFLHFLKHRFYAHFFGQDNSLLDLFVLFQNIYLCDNFDFVAYELAILSHAKHVKILPKYWHSL